MGTLTAGCPRLDSHCPHKLATSCRLTSTHNCCACADERSHSRLYRVYVDGIGFVQRGTRWQGYCWFCKEFWNNRLAATDPPIEPSQTEIPHVPDQTEFLERWFEFHQGYRIVHNAADGTESRIAVIGEPFREVSPGFLPRTIAQLREGRINDATRPENRMRRRRLTSEEERPDEPQENIEDAIDNLLAEISDEEAPATVAPSTRQEPGPEASTSQNPVPSRHLDRMVRVFGTREDVQRDDYESPLATMYTRAEARYQQAEERRASGNVDATDPNRNDQFSHMFHMLLAQQDSLRMAVQLEEEAREQARAESTFTAILPTNNMPTSRLPLEDQVRPVETLSQMDGRPTETSTPAPLEPLTEPPSTEVQADESGSDFVEQEEQLISDVTDRIKELWVRDQMWLTGIMDRVRRDHGIIPSRANGARAIFIHSVYFNHGAQRRRLEPEYRARQRNAPAITFSATSNMLAAGPLDQVGELPASSNTSTEQWESVHDRLNLTMSSSSSENSEHPTGSTDPPPPLPSRASEHTTSGAPDDGPEVSSSLEELHISEETTRDRSLAYPWLFEPTGPLGASNPEQVASLWIFQRFPKPPPPTLDAPERPPPLTEVEMTKNLACQVCYVQIGDIVLVPCGHMCMCVWCADQVIPLKNGQPLRPSKCPMCRRAVKQRVKVYIRG